VVILNNNIIIKTRKTKAIVKDLEIEFEEKYCMDETGNEVYVKEIEMENDVNLYDIYKKQKGLLTSEQVKKIRNKYHLTQKDFAFSIGLGEITIHRIENGTIQTESINTVIRLSNDPSNMKDLIIKNSSNISDDCYERTMKILNEIIKLKSHKIANINCNEIINVDFCTADLFDVANAVILKYNSNVDKISSNYKIETEYITNLKLQKLLYYVQGISRALFKKNAFNDAIFAWKHGPVVSKAYDTYKNGHNSVKATESTYEVSEGLSLIIDAVINSYGKISAYSLIDITHEEEPWKFVAINNEIAIDLLQDYFEKVYIECE